MDPEYISLLVEFRQLFRLVNGRDPQPDEYPGARAQAFHREVRSLFGPSDAIVPSPMPSVSASGNSLVSTGGSAMTADELLVNQLTVAEYDLAVLLGLIDPAQFPRLQISARFADELRGGILERGQTSPQEFAAALAELQQISAMSENQRRLRALGIGLTNNTPPTVTGPSGRTYPKTRIPDEYRTYHRSNGIGYHVAYQGEIALAVFKRRSSCEKYCRARNDMYAMLGTSNGFSIDTLNAADRQMLFDGSGTRGNQNNFTPPFSGQ